MTCECLDKMDVVLKEHNGGFVCTLLETPSRVCIETHKLQTGRGKKSPPRVIASFCPWCGEKYVGGAVMAEESRA